MSKSTKRKRNPSKLITHYETDLNSRYKTLSILGEGTFGKVIKAKDLKTNDIVAIKLQKKRFASFKDEIRIMKKIAKNCKNLVCIRDYGETSDKKMYIVMDYIKGVELDQFYKSRRTLSLKTDLLKKHFKTLVTTVKFLHDSGLSHSDIKPNNILIDENNKLHLVDLGGSCDQYPCSSVYTEGFIPLDVQMNIRLLNYRQSGDKFAIGMTLLYILDSHAFEDFENSFFEDISIIEKVKSKLKSRYLKQILDLLDLFKKNNTWDKL
jgi:dual-specificity kinase